MEEFNCHRSTFEDWWAFAIEGHYSGRCLNRQHRDKELKETRRMYSSDTTKCYFCSSKENLHHAHLIYEPDNELVVVLCNSCHKKFDRLIDYIEYRKNLKLPQKSLTK